MVEPSALEAVCATRDFLALGQSNRRWLFLRSQLQTAFSQGSAQKGLEALFLYSAAHAVSQWAQCFLDLFPHFSGVPLFLLLIEMPGYYQLLSSIILFPTAHCSCVWFCSGPCLVFTWGPYLGYITPNVSRTRAETSCWDEQKADSQVSDGTVRKTFLKDPDGTVWLLLLEDAGLTTRMWDWAFSSRMEQEGKDLFIEPF